VKKSVDKFLRDMERVSALGRFFEPSAPDGGAAIRNARRNARELLRKVEAGDKAATELGERIRREIP
jgi:hypothetical protein